jgi:lipopolysaccharide export system ATP-binding protein
MLEVKHLGKSYQGKRVVKDVSFTVNKSEVVGLLGPNGAGKTTSFYLTIGLIKSDYGTVSLNNQDITHVPMYRRARMGLGYLPQESSIFRNLTVAENVMGALEIVEPDAETREKRLEELLAEFSISHLHEVKGISLSGGERRKVEIARCLATNPQYILLDEPLAGIDPIAISDVKANITHLKNRGIGILMTDHNVREALEMMDRAYIIHDGSVLFSGDAESIVQNEPVRKVYLGEQFRY